MNIIEILRERAAQQQSQPAIITAQAGQSRAITFAELEKQSAQLAALLHQAGLQRGEAVLVFYPMSIELYIVLLAVFRLGLVAMFLDPSAGRQHIDRCCQLHAPAALIASAKAHLLRFISPALRRIPKKFSIGFPVPGAISINRAQQQSPELQIASAEAQTPALITFTSGSTGQPKAALRTHGFLLAQHAVLKNSLTLQQGESDLTTLPIFVLANLASGVTSIIPNADLRFPGKVAPAPIVQQIVQQRPVSTAASPAFLERLTDYCLQQKITLPDFQKVFTGGAPVFPRLLDKMQRVAPQAKVVAVYGSTEAEPIAEIARHEITPQDDLAMRSGRGLLTGHPVPEIQVRILRNQWGTPIQPCTRAAFDAACLPAETSGEIVVSGAHVLSGYLHGTGDEETKFRVDDTVWHRTGDAGCFDASGRLWLLGRCAATIQDARGTIHPFAVECAAHYFDAISRTAFLQHHNQRLLVLEARSEGIESESLKQNLAWAQIDEVRILKRIPVDKRHNAKIDYPALEKLLG